MANKFLKRKKKSEVKNELEIKDNSETKDNSEINNNIVEADTNVEKEKKAKKRKNKDRARRQENIFLLILVIILLGSFASIGYLFYKYFYAGASSNKYGDRLDGIENYPLPSSLESDIKSLYSDEKSVDTVKVTVEGKVIYITIGFSESLKVENAQSLAVKSLEKIGENNLTFYDVQLILKYTGTEENENYPVFGSKSSNSLKVVW